MDVVPLLKQLSEATGIAGQEGPVRELIRTMWEPFVDSFSQDKLGNLIALKHGTGSEPRPKLMLAAHMDEIGLIVTGLEREFIRIGRVGGTDPRVLLGLEVIVHGERDLPGIVATRPPHVLSRADRRTAVPWENIFIDVGLPEDEVRALVSIGDLVSMRRDMSELKNRRVAGKALDDRACVAAVTLALEQLARVKHEADVFAVATVQEETGLKGAVASAYGTAPDLAIALDVTFGKQPGTPEAETFALGAGPTIGLGPNFHPKLVDRLKKVADRYEIPYAIEPIPGQSGTDAWAIQIAREGVPTALLSIPVRYMHQPVETLDCQDVERTGRLLAAFIADLQSSFLEELTWGENQKESE
ncbi:MAG: M42 family metallopeptidase [Anaerolineae bacterium]|nr:M42 family metallopeptidase [Anaerolineae bacterium]